MVASKILFICPKDDPTAITPWAFAPEERALAEQTLKELFPDGSHIIVETECSELSAEEFESRCFNSESWD